MKSNDDSRFVLWFVNNIQAIIFNFVIKKEKNALLYQKNETTTEWFNRKKNKKVRGLDFLIRSKKKFIFKKYRNVFK